MLLFAYGRPSRITESSAPPASPRAPRRLPARALARAGRPGVEAEQAGALPLLRHGSSAAGASASLAPDQRVHDRKAREAIEIPIRRPQRPYAMLPA